MVADNQEPSADIPFDSAIGGAARVLFSECIQPLFHATFPRRLLVGLPSPAKQEKSLPPAQVATQLPMNFTGSVALANSLYNRGLRSEKRNQFGAIFDIL